MSLAIDVDKVQQVLLHDGWHAVRENSFTLDSYEFIWNAAGEYNPELDHENKGKERFLAEARQLVHGGGQSGVCATGFQFKSDEGVLSGPLTAILAVNHLV